MSCTQTAIGAGQCPHRNPSVPLGAEARLRDAAFAYIARAVARWIARGRQRRDLAELDDRLLADIGVTRAQVAREAAKPFWRD